MKNFVINAKNKIKSIDKTNSIITIYDNFDFMIDRRDEKIENTQIMRSITIFLMFQKQDFTTKFLKQKM